nr:glycosyltransferase [uncultured Devosia sp.]
MKSISKPIAYLTGEYPKVSHTFIQREIEALRRIGLDIETFSVRRPASQHILADQKQEEQKTFYILEACKNPARATAIHCRALFGRSGRYFTTLQLAIRLRQAGVRSLVYQLIYFFEAVILAHELSRRQIGHIHNHFGDSSCTVAMLASTLSDIPYSFTEHGPNIFFEAGRWRLDEKIARAEFVVAISHFCCSQLMLFSDAKHWSRIAIVHCGVSPAGYASGKGPGKRLIYVGRVEPVKGLLVLLDAMVELKQAHPDIELTVVGDGTSRKMIEARASELGLTDVTRFVGYKTQREVATLLSEADMLVLPSFAEGVPVVLMEAMASGKPVVASRVAGVQELVEDGVNGFTVPPGDAQALALRVNQLIGDPALSRRMGLAGRSTVEQSFNTDLEAERLAALLTGNVRQDRETP